MMRSVLLVDGDLQSRAVISRLLAALGLTVIGEADNAPAALAAACRLQPAGVLVDVELPDGDGIALARKLAALPWHPRIVLTSVDADIATDDDARRAGAEAFVKKIDLAKAPLVRLLGGDPHECADDSVPCCQARCAG